MIITGQCQSAIFKRYALNKVAVIENRGTACRGTAIAQRLTINTGEQGHCATQVTVGVIDFSGRQANSLSTDRDCCIAPIQRWQLIITGQCQSAIFEQNGLNKVAAIENRGTACSGTAVVQRLTINTGEQGYSATEITVGVVNFSRRQANSLSAYRDCRIVPIKRWQLIITGQCQSAIFEQNGLNKVAAIHNIGAACSGAAVVQRLTGNTSGQGYCTTQIAVGVVNFSRRQTNRFSTDRHCPVVQIKRWQLIITGQCQSAIFKQYGLNKVTAIENRGAACSGTTVVQ